MFAGVRSLIVWTALSSLALTTHAQNCTIQAPNDHELHPVWGGETWATFSDSSGGSLRIWTGEDGGRIRFSTDGGLSWKFAATPADHTHSIFDIWFFPNSDHGFATGRGGRVLETTNGGQSWTNYGARILDAAGDPATLWGVRSLGDGIVFASGLWSFYYTDDYGQTWNPITVYESRPLGMGGMLPSTIPLTNLELFRLDFVGTSSSFVGCVGGEWEDPSSNSGRGVVLFTDSSLPESSGGHKWWVVLDDSVGAPPGTGGEMLKPWSVRYERGSTNLASSVAYVCGGPGGNELSRIYRTADSGRTWNFETVVAVTPYDTASPIGGTAVVVGYSGDYWLRDPLTGDWTASTMPSNSTWEPTPGLSRGALLGVSTFGTQGLITTGDFGSQRISYDLGATWTSMSPFYPNSDEVEQRLYDCAFQPSSPLTGCLVGQGGRIMCTTDGGCTFQDAVTWGSGPTLRGIDFGDANFGVAVGDKASMLYTGDGGQSWSFGVRPKPQPNKMRFRGVSAVGSTEAWAVGYRTDNTALVAYSNDGGATWSLKTPPATGDLRLEAVAFIDSTSGLVVGHSDNGTGNRVGRAFEATYDSQTDTLTWTEVTPTFSPGPSRLLDVAASGTSLATATACAVGDGGLVLEWTGSTFTSSRKTVVDLSAVDVSPSGSVILVGSTYDNDLSTADSKGYMLRRDSSGVWSQIRVHTGKDPVGISLTSDTRGYVVGQPDGMTTASFINGNLASSILLRYIAN